MNNPTKHSQASSQRKITPVMILRFLLYLFLLPVILFTAGGTIQWLMGWLYVAIYILSVMISRLIIMRKYPDLLVERGRFVDGENIKTWDRILVPLVGLYGPLLSLLVAGLDKRFGWTGTVSVPIQWTMLITVIAASAFSTWALVVNRFFSSVVRIQKNRGHTVIKSGPYRIVRHPGYAGGVLAQLAAPIMLGSLWALIPSGLVAAAIIVRTTLEDRTLRKELPGYEEYAHETRWRLIPGIW